MEITRAELRDLLAASDGDKYIFDENTTFIKEQNVTVESGANFYNGIQPSRKMKERNSDENPMILELMPICMDNEEYAREFLEAVVNKNALEITEMVKTYRDQKKISAQSCHHKLWKLLHDNNIYKLTERNWNDRIKY